MNFVVFFFSWQVHVEIQENCFKDDIFASRRVHRRDNHDYEILYSLDDPESLFTRSEGKEQKGTTQLER